MYSQLDSFLYSYEEYSMFLEDHMSYLLLNNTLIFNLCYKYNYKVGINLRSEESKYWSNNSTPFFYYYYLQSSL